MSGPIDPRLARSREAILDAAIALLRAEGPAAVTHVRIAEHAGVGRATVYRHWPRTEQLLAEAMATVAMPFFDEPRSPYREWMEHGLTAIAEQLDLPDVRAVTTTLASTALWDPVLDERRAGFAALLADRLRAGIEAAREAGELEPTSDLSTAAALAIGPLYYRATIDRASAGPDLVKRCVDMVGRWAAASAPPERSAGDDAC